MAELRVDHALERSVTVSAGDAELFTYVYRPDTVQLESPKPYLHPIRTLAGDLVSLFRPHDHVWHKGIAWSLPHVGEHNFWGGPTYVHGQFYVQRPNNGSAVHRRMLELDRGRLVHELDWLSQAGAPVIAERRALTFRLADDVSWALTFDTSLTNVSGATLAFGSPTTKGRENAGYGGLFWRGPRSFTGGVIRSPSASGGDELRGERAEWFAFRGSHDGSDRRSTVLLVDDTANPHHPPQWFARSEQFACLNPAPFFSEELDLPDQKTVRFRYAVVVATGEPEAEKLAGHGRAALHAAAAP
ncbi:PmoA family protein [Actinoplanes sp. NPDC020271]|uniref:PmoA family protein n=1 Tax=Actinoplanes sp. NPDC020271 TaxID=3363896 RepID=UPI0037B185C1